MPMPLRKLGVHGKNAPTRQKKSIRQSDFSIAGIVGLFERKYDKAMECRDPSEYLEKMGAQIDSSWYGPDIVNLLFSNLRGNEAKVYVKSHVGFDGTNIDAVVASKDVNDNQGLPSAITLANALKTTLNAHAADAVEHTAADAVNFPISTDDCYDLASLLALTGELLAAYDAHDADAELSSGWAFHVAQEGSDHSLVTAVTPANLSAAITRLNDLKAKYNAHDTDATAHTTGGTHHESATDASSTPVATLKGQSAYKEELDYGLSGNRTGYTITHGTRFETQLAAAIAVSDTEAELDSVSGIRVGDLVGFRATGGTAAVVYKKITTVNESEKKISWSGAFSASAQGVINDGVFVPGFKIRTYRKSTTGIVSEVETALGEQWCSMEPEVTEYYVQNVHSQNKWIKWVDQGSASTTIESFPVAVSTVTYLESGADGTTPTTSSHWSRDLTKMNGLPIRMLGNPETSTLAIQKAGESYCAGRDDTPLWIATFPENQTESQLKTQGGLYQRSGDVFQVNVAEWLEISDPFNTAPNAPARVVPNVGAVMGAWIRTIAEFGIHYIPAIAEVSLFGILGIKNDNLGENVDDRIRTDIAEYGVNIIQFVEGSGYRIRNFFTASISDAERFANGIIMRNFIKVSSEDSLQSTENKPNTFNRIRENKEAIRAFMYKLWRKGSTGSVPTGETFGIQEDEEGNLTNPEDHFEVIADAVNNTQVDINQGEQNYDVGFTFPTPAGSVEIRVGLILN